MNRHTSFITSSLITPLFGVTFVEKHSFQQLCLLQRRAYLAQSPMLNPLLILLVLLVLALPLPK